MAKVISAPSKLKVGTMPFVPGRMKSRRKEVGLSQKGLAKKVGIPYQRIQEYERGKSEPKGSRLGLIAEALDCTSDYLLGLSDAPGEYSAEIDAETIELARSIMQFPKAIRDALIGIAKSMHDASNKR
jgi:transcriptional regulator with XRE-family HTH domain